MRAGIVAGTLQRVKAVSASVFFFDYDLFVNHAFRQSRRFLFITTLRQFPERLS